MITTSGFQTLTKIIQDTLKLDIDKHHVSYTIEKDCNNCISIHKCIWATYSIIITKHIDVFSCKACSEYFNEKIQSAYESIHADIEAILARGNEPCSEQ